MAKTPVEPLRGAAGAPSEPPDAVADLAERVREITRSNERLFQELLAGERRFRRLARAVWRVQEEERRRLARELHDGIGQTLTALKNQLELLATRTEGAVAAEVEEAVELATHALRDTRELSRLLRPAVLDDLGLVPALRWLARTLRQRTGLRVDLEIEDTLERQRTELETLVFRVVQEALTNALKHSGTDRVEVRLVANDGALRLRIADAGKGFEPSAALGPADGAAGVGLRGIQDRVELFGGRLRIRSRPGAGTELEIHLPLEGGTPGEKA